MTTKIAVLHTRNLDYSRLQLMKFVFYLYVFYEQESSTAAVNYNCYGQEQQTRGMNVRFKIHTSFIKNMWALTKHYDIIVMMNANICRLYCHRKMSSNED